MTWELGYFCGLLSGAAFAGLVGVFLHARSWSEWKEAFDAMQAKAIDWGNRFVTESKRAAILDAKFGALADDLAGCRQHNAEADEEVLTLTALLADMTAKCGVACGHHDAIAADYQEANDRNDRLLEERDAAVAESVEAIDRHKSAFDRAGRAIEIATKANGELATVTDERDGLRSQLTDTHETLDAAMMHVEQLVMRRDAAIVARDSLLTQVRGAVEASEATRDAAIAQFDALSTAYRGAMLGAVRS